MALLTSLKEFARSQFPRAFATARSAKDRFVIEWRVIRHLRLRDFTRAVGSKALWKTALPTQRARSAKVNASFASVSASIQGGHAAGGHAVYLSPTTWAASPIAALRAHYPPDAGLKIVRQAGRVSVGEYMSGSNHSHIQRHMLHSHPHLLLVANVLNIHDAGPRAYDLIEIEFSDGVHAGYVSRHVEGRAPNDAEWTAGMNALKALGGADVVNVVVPGGFEHTDFQKPDCNGNAIVDAKGRFNYVDFQNFVLGDYATFLEKTAREASAATHFGDASWIRGGSYLYQTVPGLARPAKRDIELRMQTIRRLLEQSGVKLSQSAVLDVGCNLGMIIAAYLREGAVWCHGWDFPKVTPHTERLLLGVGCTRFSLTSATLNKDYALGADIPAFIGKDVPIVMSYLAVRLHLGWLPALKTIPWSALIYEGHEGEGKVETTKFLNEFCGASGARVAAAATYRDGDSEERELAVLVRSPS